jgi:hypothetical protein
MSTRDNRFTPAGIVATPQRDCESVVSSDAGS